MDIWNIRNPMETLYPFVVRATGKPWKKPEIISVWYLHEFVAIILVKRFRGKLQQYKWPCSLKLPKRKHSFRKILFKFLIKNISNLHSIVFTIFSNCVIPNYFKVYGMIYLIIFRLGNRASFRIKYFFARMLFAWNLFIRMIILFTALNMAMFLESLPSSRNLQKWQFCILNTKLKSIDLTNNTRMEWF